jgi:hypothetical protein
MNRRDFLKRLAVAGAALAGVKAEETLLHPAQVEFICRPLSFRTAAAIEAEAKYLDRKIQRKAELLQRQLRCLWGL